MANDCCNRLIVVGLRGIPEEFVKLLERAMYRKVLPRGEYYSVVAGKGSKPEFCFNTKWQPPANALMALSKKFSTAHLLLEYSCWESGFRGQMVICNGEVIEYEHRLGYDGPAFLFADTTHPLVRLWDPYMEPRTLEQQALNRLRDAIAIVRGLKQTLEDRRFTDSPYRACGDEKQVIRAREHLTAMLEVMIRHALEISFDGVLAGGFLDCGVLDVYMKARERG